jgi:hypothetical protein
MIVHVFTGFGILAVALDLVAKRSDLLAMAPNTSLADVDIPSEYLERRIRLYTGNAGYILVYECEWNEFHQSADQDGDGGQNAKRYG